MVLGEAVGGHHVRVHARARMTVGGVIGILGMWELLARRIRLLLVEGIREGGLLRLVVGREGPVGEACRHEDPTPPFGLHNEGAVAPDRILGDSVVRGLVVGALGRAEVGDVFADPLLLLLVPPDVLLALRPGPALGVGRGTVVNEAAVHRPRPGPLGGYPTLLGAGLAAGCLVGLVGVAAGVDPAPARRRAVVFERQVALERVVLGVPAAYLAQHCLGVRVLYLT